MILDQFGQPIDPAKQHAIMMFAPSRLDPVLGGGAIEENVVNSSGQGTFTFGGWIFPIDSSADRGHIKAGIRDDNGDNVFINDEYAATIDPPDYTLQTIVHSVSESWTSGNGVYGSDTNCANISNGARIVKSAGVSATFSMDITIIINISSDGPDTCPGGGGPSTGGVHFTKRYTITVNFSG